jgi:hypothetical protein
MLSRIAVGLLVVSACALSVMLALAKSDDRPIRADPRWSAYRDQLSITWSDNVFIDKKVATYWLDDRAYGYAVWARRHPPAAERLNRSSR